ncbi:MAG TPA: hypothetical protein VGV34_08625, partial [Solirubrobacterales bacterium]|nr:hypothetical protein [Solirubrobacterales bacterium]
MSRVALKVSQLHADLLGSLHEEIGTNGDSFAEAAQRLAGDFGAVTATALDAAEGSQGDPLRSNGGEAPE